MKRFLIINTAFLGDVILTLPLVQVLKRAMPGSQIDFVVIPETSDVVRSHPDISNVIVYDKHGKQRSLLSFLLFRNQLRAATYDVVICPHRSLRSCLLARGMRAKIRIGFDNSAMKMCFTNLLPWRFGVHEVDRNLSLLEPLSIMTGELPAIQHERPKIFLAEENVREAEQFITEHKIGGPFAVLAPGTTWQTKRYPAEMMARVAKKLSEKFAAVVIIGGRRDVEILESFHKMSDNIISAIGKFSIMTSAEIIRRSSLMIANDSAPVHIASSFNVPTVAIFGPTVKDFGFYPYHKRSTVIEVRDLGCRPCSIHGGPRCPIGTFDCMKKISPDEIVRKALEILNNG
ncbi:MAG TPA: glycosyltransferase family 9 protein [Candidatus Acidoferrales bacterium]|nr:glycosyltransferase family 9 protein [Candidatus Acidoferrales bacterium]